MRTIVPSTFSAIPVTGCLMSYKCYTCLPNCISHCHYALFYTVFMLEFLFIHRYHNFNMCLHVRHTPSALSAFLCLHVHWSNCCYFYQLHALIKTAYTCTLVGSHGRYSLASNLSNSHDCKEWHGKGTLGAKETRQICVVTSIDNIVFYLSSSLIIALVQYCTRV